MFKFKLMLPFALLVLPLGAGDLSGKWLGTVRSDGKQIPLYLELQQQGEEIAGAVGMRPDFLSSLGKVHLAGRSLTFEFQFPAGPAGRFAGVFDGDRASGLVTFNAPSSSGRLEMIRIGRPARLPVSLDRAIGGDDLAALSDEFDNQSTLRNWKRLSDAEGWPDRIEKVATSEGHLYVVPQSGAWWAGYHGVYFFKEVKGDFAIATRVKVTGKSGREPTKMWTISGLLVRAPADAKISREQRKENWLYLMTGRGPGEGRVIDAKSTLDSINAWDVTAAQPGGYELRIARVGPVFIAMCRPDGGDWMLRKRIVREDLPETLQAGINVTSDFKLSSTMPAAKYNADLFPGASSADSVTTFDFVRFSRLAGTAELRSKLAGKEVVAVNDADLLALFR